MPELQHLTEHWTLWHTLISSGGVGTLAVMAIKAIVPGFMDGVGGSLWDFVRGKHKKKRVFLPRTEAHLWRWMEKINKQLAKCNEGHSDCKVRLAEARTTSNNAMIQVAQSNRRITRLEKEILKFKVVKLRKTG